MDTGLKAKTGHENGVNKAVNLEASGQSTPRHDGKGDVIPMYRGCPALLYWDWLFRFWVYHDTPSHWISWWAAAGFFFGGNCFIIGSFTSVAPAIYGASVIGNCMGDPFDWLVSFLYLLGNSFWFVAVCFQMIEALNVGYDARVYEWEASNRQGPKPRFRWFGLPLAQLDWWGALSYTIGVAMYWVAALSTILNDCPNSTLSTDEYLWLIDYFYIIAGFLFLLAGALYEMAEISIWLIPGIIVPLSWRDAKSLKWWGLYVYFWGGVGFCLGGIQLYWNSPINVVEPLPVYNIITGVGFGGGAILFTFGAALLLARQARGRCRPSYGVVGRLDPTIHVGNEYGRPVITGVDKV